jgi:hypothetical protein
MIKLKRIYEKPERHTMAPGFSSRGSGRGVSARRTCTRMAG